MVWQTCSCCRNWGYSLNDSVTLWTISATACNFCFLSSHQEQQFYHQKHCLCNKADWSLCVITTTLAAEVSHQDNEQCTAVSNAWPALGWGLLLAFSVRLLLCNQQVLSCSGREGRAPSASCFRTAHASRCFLIPSLQQSKWFTSLPLASSVLICPSLQDQLCSSYPPSITPALH